MKKNIFKIMITALSIVLIIAAMPFTASAEAVPLGEESPVISAQFFDTNNAEVDGNSLVAGERYTVNLVLSNISNVGIFNLTASFTDDIDISNVTTIADVENSGFEYGGYKIDTDNSKFVAVISTVNSNYTELSGATVMVTLAVEVNNDGDFADFFTLSTGRNYTFIIANIDEGKEGGYVCTDCADVNANTDYASITYDMSPSSTVTVTGTVKVAKDVYGNTYEGLSFVGGATVNVLDANDAVVATTTTAADGTFSIVVPSGGVSLVIVATRVPQRTINLSGNDVTDYPVIPVIAIDYDGSGTFNAPDKGAFSEYYENGASESDLDGSGTANAGDKGVIAGFEINDQFNQYNDMTL